ncbi:MAG TPA: molecular chaperone HtpG [Coxiellaceae bacterium]|nr:molecular chaperone HtpG [Coxiellaceae bacterium]
MTLHSPSETRRFETEVKQLLDLVANSLYSNKEIFLRELISNASDAADKLRYEALSDAPLFENDPDLKIQVDFDPKARIITVRDNGIGMSREEVIENLGTIAKSGTKAFKEKLEADKSKDSQLIGQFGVGFYSAFIVADKVVVRTRRAGMKEDQGVYWESDAQGEYTIKNITHAPRGTEVVLHLKKGEEEFLHHGRLRSVITKYSDHILLPIQMRAEPNPDDKTETPGEYETVNQANALWTLSKSEITDEQYKELYKHVAHDFEDPLTWIHAKVEGKQEYTMLLYIPQRAPFDLSYREYRRGLKLYVKRVFIMDDAEHFLPQYLRFVKGIVDTHDLPLNISREILQTNDVVDKIRSGCVKKVLSELEQLATNEPEKYQTFWKQFGQVIKEGPGEDFSNKDRISKLLRFASTQQDSEEQTISLGDYVSRMAKDQEKIYYLTADHYITAKNSPLLEAYRQKGIEVLLLTDRVDEWLMAHLMEFEGKKFQSVAKGEFDLDKNAEAKEENKQAEKDFDSFLKQAKTLLGDRVKEVRLTHRLTDSPACVVFDENEISGHLQRLMQEAGQVVTAPKPILEVNPKHPLVLQVKGETDDARFSRFVQVLLGQALLVEGEKLSNPAEFVRHMNELLV